jgi:hypothetical protein
MQVWLLVVARSADVDQNLADGAALDGIVRVRRALERKAVEWKPDVLSDFECTVGHRGGDVGDCLIFRRARNRVDEDELVAEVAGHQFTHVQFELGAAVRRIDGNGAVQGEHGPIEDGVSGRRNLDDHIDAFRHERPDLVRGLAGPIVDGLLGSGG